MVKKLSRGSNAASGNSGVLPVSLSYTDTHTHIHTPHSGNTAHGNPGPGPQCAPSPPGQEQALWALYTQSNEGQTSCRGTKTTPEYKLYQSNSHTPSKYESNFHDRNVSAKINPE